MRKKPAVVVTAYKSHSDREKGINPIDSRTAYTLQELERAIELFSSPARYLSFHGVSEIGTADKARSYLGGEV